MTLAWPVMPWSDEYIWAASAGLFAIALTFWPYRPKAMLYICCCAPTLPGPMASVDIDANWFMVIWLLNCGLLVSIDWPMPPIAPMAEPVVPAGLLMAWPQPPLPL